MEHTDTPSLAIHAHVESICLYTELMESKCGNVKMSIEVWKGKKQEKKRRDVYGWMAGNPGLRCSVASLNAPEAQRASSFSTPEVVLLSMPTQHSPEPATARSRE